ncbi:hypothetical protein ABZY20_21650 [Streptomyces sp. NPDC006624]|uniref:hypothetical protein n=1 Tax=unclassified Streptomyces TaxID=2593676 RepID=UPI0033AE104D
MSEQRPLPPAEAWRAVAACFLASGALLAARRLHLPREHVGRRVRFADGTSARVYRETRLGSGLARNPCTLVVVFRLRRVHGAGHAVFRAESLLNTPLFAGFPGFASKLWLENDDRGRYRGLYEWDGAGRAEHYARSLWRVLALVSVPGSIGYTVLPGVRRDDVLAGNHPVGGGARDDAGERDGTSAWGPDDAPVWWRVTAGTRR